MTDKEKAPASPTGASHQQLGANEEELARKSSASAVQKTITDDLTPDTSEAVEFLRQFRPDGPWVLTCISSDKKNIETRTFRKDAVPAMTNWIENHQGNRNLYFHVNPVLRDLTKKAEKTDIAALEWLHVDIDPRAGEDIKQERERALRLLQNFRPEPTVIIDSGGGYQGFWRIEEPVPINGQLPQAEDAERYNIHLERLFAADNCHNCDRIMRLPGTVNIPDAKKRAKGRVKRIASLVYFKDENSYPLSKFTQAPKIQMEVLGFSGRTIEVSGNVPRLDSVDELDQWHVPDWLKVLIVQGHDPDNPQKYPSRSEAYYACACGLVRSGVPDEVIFSVLMEQDFGISQAILEKRRPAKYALRQIERARGAVSADWDQVNKQGQPVKSLQNTVVALRKLGVDCRYDLFRRRNLLGHHELQEFAGEFSDQGEVLLRKFIRQQFSFDPGKEHVKDAVLELCVENPFDPLVDHLESLPQWDGVQRLDTWLASYLGTADNAYTRQAGAVWLLAAIARAKQPGTKFDHMLVLVGAQGVGKSTALQILAGRDFFTDANFLGARDTREVLEATGGAWIVECAELAGMQRKDVETLKHEITKQEDKGRPAYGRHTITVPRRFILAGTTNSRRFLQDDTGNRRFWPVETTQINLPALRLDRDQIWAEALSRFECGNCQLYLTGEAKQQAEAAQKERRSADESFLEQLETLQAEGFYEGTPAIATGSVYKFLGISKEQTHRHAARVKRAMEVLGWESTTTSVRWMGEKQRLYLWVGEGTLPEIASTNSQFD